MKTILLLSSGSFLENDLSGILGRPFKDYKIAHIITASKGKGVNSLDHLERARSKFKKWGCYFEDVDIEGKNESELRNILKNFGGVFVNGGSTFYLLKCIRESGFDKIIKELLPQGFLYIGASAGSYVCCPTIEMSLWKHQDKYDHYGLTDLRALDLIPFLMTVHYSEEYKELLKEKIAMTNYQVKILNDEQAILVDEDKTVLLGGEEIIL